MPTFEFAHLSDLHFSAGADAGGSHSHSIKHLEGIEHILSGTRPDRLIVSGDLTDRGDTESLLRVHDWLHADFRVAGDRRIGLRLPPDRVRVIPGNHDAYNARHPSGDDFDCWQRSLDNYNRVFRDQPFGPASPVSYDWIEKDGFGIYFAYVDTCFLNDPSIEHSSTIVDACVTAISKPARGRLTRRQANRLLEQFDAGMRGTLALPSGSGVIAKETFAKSLKVLVMHHYMFEPPGCSDDFFLKLADRNYVLRSMGMADFDICLCGHKHHVDFTVRPYGEYFDKRARGRYCINVFRRMLGIHTMPLAFELPTGKRMARAFSNLIAVLLLSVKDEATHDNNWRDCIDQLAEILQAAVDDPHKLEARLATFIKSHGLQGAILLTPEEIDHIQRRIVAELSAAQRKQLTGVANRLQAEVIRLDSRPFLQSMSGSACKEPGTSDKRRSFNIYRIDADETGYRLRSDQYIWAAGATHFNPVPTTSRHHVEGFQRVMFPELL
jgi:hypothetical protein